MPSVRLLQDSSDRKSAPEHFVVINLDLAIDNHRADPDCLWILGHSEQASDDVIPIAYCNGNVSVKSTATV